MGCFHYAFAGRALSFKPSVYSLLPNCDKLLIVLQTFQIYKSLADLNGLPKSKAEATFRKCCGSKEWARAMTAARPFAMLDGLFETAENVWYSLLPADQLEAFAAEKPIDKKQNVVFDGKVIRKQFEEVNRLYEGKFGFMFVVNTSGKSVGEILAVCRARLGNSVETELKIAAHEQRMITEIRLKKILEK